MSNFSDGWWQFCCVPDVLLTAACLLHMTIAFSDKFQECERSLLETNYHLKRCVLMIYVDNKFYNITKELCMYRCNVHYDSMSQKSSTIFRISPASAEACCQCCEHLVQWTSLEISKIRSEISWRYPGILQEFYFVCMDNLFPNMRNFWDTACTYICQLFLHKLCLWF